MINPLHNPTDQLPGRALRHVYDDAAVGLCYLDTDLRYIHINKWLAELNGLPVEQHLGRCVRDVVPKVATGIEAQLRQVIETNTPIVDGTVEAETPSYPGVRRTFLHNYRPVEADDGSVIGVSCFVQEITGRRKAKVALERRTEELERANRDLQSALDNIKTLEGLVPICAHCKKIRNDTGFWQELESYLSQHTEARFSHGVCPACIEEDFPELKQDGE